MELLNIMIMFILCNYNCKLKFNKICIFINWSRIGMFIGYIVCISNYICSIFIYYNIVLYLNLIDLISLMYKIKYYWKRFVVFEYI